MPANEAHFRELFRKYSENTATAEERTELFRLIRERGYEQVFEELMLNELEGTVPQGGYDQLYWDGVFNELIEKAQQPEEKKIRPLIWRRLAVAVCALLVISVSGYFILHKEPVQQTAQNDPEQLAPLQKGVTLTLANGQKMLLSKKHSGQLVQIGSASVSQQDSLLNYSGNVGNEEVKMNTLTNNSSSKFSVTLSDGTQATLDIGSTLTYPVVFNKASRLVSMTGQAYFKVKHLAGQRFMVKTMGQITEDIGTEFNINGYEDEPVIKTTLVEGSVLVNEQLLKPGQQAIVSGTALSIKTADIESVTAWLQSKLIFEKEPLENIMRRVARIYGVQVVYQDEEVKKYTYFGSVNYTKKLSSVLNFFRKAGRVDFSVEGKTVTVFKAKSKK
jgi:transmembrane sensor